MPDYNDLLYQLSATMDKIKTDTDVKAAREKAADEASIETPRKLNELKSMIAESNQEAEQRAKAQQKTEKLHFWISAVLTAIAALASTAAAVAGFFALR